MGAVARTVKVYGSSVREAIIHASGQIERPGFFAPSDSWRLLGAVERNNFGRVVRRYSMAEVLESASTIPWKFKNGKQRTFVLDFDHGHMREWRSPGYTLSHW